MSLPTDHPFDFDPTYGLGVEELRAMRPPPGPADFDAFWRARYARALNVRPRLRLSDNGSKSTNWRVHDIAYVSTDGFQIGGWLLAPRAGKIRRGLVVGHGYGGRDQPDFDIPVEDTAVLFPCFRGLSRSRRAPISSDPQWHVLHDIDKRERYILGGCVEDVWVAVSALSELYPEIEGRIGYSGVSFGGGVGALAVAFDPRIQRAHLALPTFSKMPLWLSLPTVGSAHAVQTYCKTHKNALATLGYFDAATAARRIEIPMLIAVARFDPFVAPPCQFALANALPTSNQHQIVILDAGHFDYPGSQAQRARLRLEFRRFFGAT